MKGTAADTLLTPDDLLRIRKKVFSDNAGTITAIQMNTAKEQAEISFEAGMREVLDYIERNHSNAYIYEGTYTYDTNCDNQLFLDLDDWKAQLKKWGVE